MKKALIYLASICLAVLMVVSCAPKTTPTPLAAPVPATPKPVATPGAVTPAPGVATPKPVTTTPPAAITPKATVAARESYYKGKTIEVIVESAAGGGTDTIGRLTASVMPKYIPGNPKMIIRNQPGAAGAVANIIFYEKTKPDGLTLLQNSSSPVSMQIKRRDVAKYDLTKYCHIGNVMRGGDIAFGRKDQMWRLTDPKAETLVVGSKEGEETWIAKYLLGKELLGWNLRFVLGYGGTSEMELAFRRGEIDLFGSANAYIIDRLLKEGTIELIAQMGMWKGVKPVRRPDYPNCPLFLEVVGDKLKSGVSMQGYKAWIGSMLVDKFLSAPPGTPDNILADLRGAYAKMAEDAKFDEMMKKTVTEVYTVGVGEETADLIKEIVNVPPETMEWIKQLQRKHKLIKE